MLPIIIRIIIAVLIAYYFSKIALKLIRGEKKKTNFKDFKKSNEEPKEDIIDLCPKCGQVLTRNHNCQKK